MAGLTGCLGSGSVMDKTGGSAEYVLKPLEVIDNSGLLGFWLPPR